MSNGPENGQECSRRVLQGCSSGEVTGEKPSHLPRRCEEVLAGAGLKHAPGPSTDFHTSSALSQLLSLISLTPAQLLQELLGPFPTFTSALVSPAVAQTLTLLLSLAPCLLMARSQPFSLPPELDPFILHGV